MATTRILHRNARTVRIIMRNATCAQTTPIESRPWERSVGGWICLPATMERCWTSCTCRHMNDPFLSTESCCFCNHKKYLYCQSV
ncbi:hypothetical protein BDW71DRAFT_100998 [Aspergillus fruticulosus]